MPSTREAALAALFDLIDTASPAICKRNEPLLGRIESAGLVHQFDGDPGDPEVTLGPVTYQFQHAVEIEAFVQDRTGKDAAFDALLNPIGAALQANRTLGGAVDYADVSAPSVEDRPIEGGEPIKAGLLTVTLHYTTSDPLN